MYIYILYLKLYNSKITEINHPLTQFFLLQPTFLNILNNKRKEGCTAKEQEKKASQNNLNIKINEIECV